MKKGKQDGMDVVNRWAFSGWQVDWTDVPVSARATLTCHCGVKHAVSIETTEIHCPCGRGYRFMVFGPDERARGR